LSAGLASRLATRLSAGLPTWLARRPGLSTWLTGGTRLTAALA
jgi:hypothetical protein